MEATAVEPYWRSAPEILSRFSVSFNHAASISQ